MQRQELRGTFLVWFSTLWDSEGIGNGAWMFMIGSWTLKCWPQHKQLALPHLWVHSHFLIFGTDRVEYDVKSEVEKMDRDKSAVGIPRAVADLSESGRWDNLFFIWHSQSWDCNGWQISALSNFLKRALRSYHHSHPTDGKPRLRDIRILAPSHVAQLR